MGFLKSGTGTGDKSEDQTPEKSVYFSDERIDRHGVVWKKQGFWFRKEYLGKLGVIAHFEGREPQELVDKALGQYIAERFDKSQALRKLVEQSAGKGRKAGK